MGYPLNPESVLDIVRGVYDSDISPEQHVSVLSKVIFRLSKSEVGRWNSVLVTRYMNEGSCFMLRIIWGTVCDDDSIKELFEAVYIDVATFRLLNCNDAFRLLDSAQRQSRDKK